MSEPAAMDEVRERMVALARLDGEHPDVARFLRVCRGRDAKPEENLREWFLAPLLAAMGHSPTSEFHLSDGDADYVLATGDPSRLVAVEVKPPDLRIKVGDPRYRNSLARHLAEKAKYLADRRVQWLVLTDGISWLFYDRSVLSDGDRPILELNGARLVSTPGMLARFGPARIADTLHAEGERSRRLGLEERFFAALEQWVDIVQHGLAPGAPRDAATSLLNKLIFARSLEDLGCVPHRRLARALEQAGAHWKPAQVAARFLAEVNDWFFELYDTELFEEPPPAVHADALRAVLLGAPARGRLLADDLYSFDFARLDVDVLGHVYERFLAARRREQGIFYTRKEVVDGIVERTVGRRVDGVVEGAVAALSAGRRAESSQAIEKGLLALRVIDPACGSGSFLMAAYARIMRGYGTWLAAFRAAEAAQGAPSMLFSHVAAPSDMDKRVLVACIFGVDLDPGAVSVAKLNLWLSMVRADPSPYDWVDLQSRESNHVLPPLKCNLFTANSLVGPAAGEILRVPEVAACAARAEQMRAEAIASFSDRRHHLDQLVPAMWEQSCTELRRDGHRVPGVDGRSFLHDLHLGLGRFDVVLGNPPYVGEEDHKDIFREVRDWPLLAEAYEGKMDYAYFFLHLGKVLLKPGGDLCYILPIYFEKAHGAAKLDAMLASSMTLLELFYFGDVKVFSESAPGQHNVVLWARHAVDAEARPRVARVRAPWDLAAVWRAYMGDEAEPCTRWYRAPRHADLLDERGGLRLAPAGAEEICERMAAAPRRLGELVNVNQGVVAGPNDVGRKSLVRLVQQARGRDGAVADDEVEALCRRLHLRLGEGVFVLSRQELHALDFSASERALLVPFHPARQVRRYAAEAESDSWLLYLDRETCPDVARFPRVSRHLARVRPVIALCEEVREGRHAHFHLHRPRDRAIFTSPKLVGPRQTEAPAYAYVPGDYYVDLACEVMTLPEPAPDAEEQLLALLALLNSGPSYFWLYHRGGRKGELLQLDKGPLDGVPVPAWNPELRAALATHARQLGVLATLLRDGPDLAVRVGDPPRDATLRSLLHGPWCDALLRRERGDLSASGVPRANWLAGTLRLAVGAGEVEARFIDPVFARWAQLAIEATLRAAPCKIKGVSALLDAPLATAAGGSVRREQAASWLATLDAHARSLGVPALDLPAIEREIAVRDGEVDTLVADALGISDVPVDLLRRPGDAY